MLYYSIATEPNRQKCRVWLWNYGRVARLAVGFKITFFACGSPVPDYQWAPEPGKCTAVVTVTVWWCVWPNVLTLAYFLLISFSRYLYQWF